MQGKQEKAPGLYDTAPYGRKFPSQIRAMFPTIQNHRFFCFQTPMTKTRDERNPKIGGVLFPCFHCKVEQAELAK